MMERLIAAAQAIRDQADRRFELEDWRPIDTLLLSELTEAVEDIEQSVRQRTATVDGGEGER